MHRLLCRHLKMDLLAPKVLLDYLRRMITIPSNPIHKASLIIKTGLEFI